MCVSFLVLLEDITNHSKEQKCQKLLFSGCLMAWVAVDGQEAQWMDGQMDRELGTRADSLRERRKGERGEGVLPIFKSKDVNSLSALARALLL